MRKCISLLLPAVLLIACTNTNTPKDQIAEKEVIDFIKQYDALWANRDTTGMKTTMADNYIYFSSHGNTTTRDRIISWFTPTDKYKVDTAIRTEISVSINNNTAIVSSRWVGSGSFDGERFRDDQRCSLTIQKENGKSILIGLFFTRPKN